jgi:DNA-binding protein HU-beta
MATNLMTRAKTASASAKKAATPKKAEVVTLKSVFEEIGESHDLAKKQAHGMLGILEVKDRPARTARNPGTGATIEIAASKKVSFRAAKELKEAI